MNKDEKEIEAMILELMNESGYYYDPEVTTGILFRPGPKKEKSKEDPAIQRFIDILNNR